MVSISLQRLRDEDGMVRAMEAVGDDAAVFRAMVGSYVVGSIVLYGGFITALYWVLHFMERVHGVDSFLEAQFLYNSNWRTAILVVMAINNVFWATRKKDWLAMGMIFGPALLSCIVIQIVLFFNHLY